MGKATADGASSQMFSADVVAAVLMASGTTSISNKQYEMMSALDGTRTASSFQHSFRAVLAKAKDLKSRVENGEIFAPVQPANKRNGVASPATPKKRKAPEDGGASPKKKVATPKARVKKTALDEAPAPVDDAPVQEATGLHDGLEFYSSIKNEFDLENEYI